MNANIFDWFFLLFVKESNTVLTWNQNWGFLWNIFERNRFEWTQAQKKGLRSSGQEATMYKLT